MTKAILFFDIDGTLLDHRGQVPPSNRRAIQELKQRDYLPVICTGRGRGELGTILVDTGIDTAILLNGMEILQKKTLLFQDKIALKLVQQLQDLTQQLGHSLGYYSQGSIKVAAYDETMRQNFVHFHQNMPQITNIQESAKNCQMLLLFSDQPQLDTVYQQAMPQLTFSRNSPYSIDVTPAGLDKGAGIRRLLQLLDLNLPTYAFGDGLNDLSMFATVDTAIAMENGRAETKQAADYITLSNDKDGVPHALKQLEIIKS